MDNKKYTVSFSMISSKEYELIINALKRQVDYYRNRVFNNDATNDNMLYHLKYNYKVYCDLYEKIINDYNKVVNSD